MSASDSADEKQPVAQHVDSVRSLVTIDNIQVLGLSREDTQFYTDFSAEQKKALLWKIDIRLVPMLAVLYLISQIDRANIGNAKIEGLTEDLRLSGIQYNIVLSIFFVPYVLLEVPSNMLLKSFFRPSIYLGILITGWGIVMTLTGIVQNFAGMLVTRLLLGVFEAGFYPAAVYLCTFWYMPKDLAYRISIFYCASALSGAFSGLLAAGIAQMDGIGGQEGWRWIFLLEGLATVVLGVMCFFLLIDSPSTSSKWLRPDEIRYLELQHFIKEGGDFKQERKRVSWEELKAVFLNWRLYMMAYILLCQSASAYGLKFTMPTITKAMGFTNTNAQLMVAPPYIAGAISAICFSKLSDRFYWRMPFVVIPLAVVTIGYSIVISFHGRMKDNVGPSYFAMILACMGLYPVHPATSTWLANNLAPSGRRAIGLAFSICIGNAGGVIGSYMYMDKEAPTYYTGFGLSLAFGGSGLIVALLLELSFIYANRRKAAQSESEIRERYTDDQLLAMGDKSPLFKYTL
ncbi:putative MFS transporter [Aspergillus pseudonomiae]|uniref:Putative MFS transporter n=1 Tax=Aspergillus pseudonomiae TaxID=1506151 RepID=A0A5N7CUD3_9EURO|nr:putative MFS transporter [Aspergillus pseudonomiae]KAB8257387.1 putative MFS transporter [Aspergillus pseudonomiae]KAE8397805.1 putative MFS transporter [Aspergillus pseudonomiae]